MEDEKEIDKKKLLLSCEIRLKKKEDFKIIMETLERIGLEFEDEKGTLFQQCYILYKKQRHYIVHFMEMLALDDESTIILEDDIAIRNFIATQLEKWGLIEFVYTNPDEPILNADNNGITIVRHEDKKNWNLKKTYKFGNEN